MNNEDFIYVLARQQAKCYDTLVAKGREYAPDEDKLHNFKIAAQSQGITPRQALAGMMAKHTVSIFDMCRSEELYTPEQWDEKITDHINYLILLKALVVEEGVNATADVMFPNF
jgi:hypothetical protein